MNVLSLKLFLWQMLIISKVGCQIRKTRLEFFDIQINLPMLNFLPLLERYLENKNTWERKHIQKEVCKKKTYIKKRYL